MPVKESLALFRIGPVYRSTSLVRANDSSMAYRLYCLVNLLHTQASFMSVTGPKTIHK